MDLWQRRQSDDHTAWERWVSRLVPELLHAVVSCVCCRMSLLQAEVQALDR